MNIISLKDLLDLFYMISNRNQIWLCIKNIVLIPSDRIYQKGFKTVLKPMIFIFL